MRNLLFTCCILLLYNCSAPSPSTTESTSNNIRTEVKEQPIPEEKTAEPTKPAIAEMQEETATDVLKGTFMYYADAANFVDCATSKKYKVTGRAYKEMEGTYLELRTEQFQKIYVEVKGEYSEDKAKKPILIANELVTIDVEKSCE